MIKTISPIAIDLGGKYTGLYMPHYLYGTLPESSRTVMATVVAAEDGGKMTWSQINRTATRHRIRSNKRRKLAKRLLRIVLAEALQRALTSKEWSALSGLLNRRGYNRLEVDIDLSCLDDASASAFEALLPDFFTAAASMPEQWSELEENISVLRSLQSEEAFSFNKRDAKKELFQELDKEQKDINLLAYHTLQETVEQILDSIDFGHQHRSEYLNAIKGEITKDSRLTEIKEKLGADGLYRLIGNISNFQLRNLRWYFNDKSMKNGDVFITDKLSATAIRWLQYWHPQTQEEKENRRVALAHFKEHDALHALKTLDPLRTIPPYEDQNNRRPPKDQTLWLNPASLTHAYGEKWKIWANNLKKRQPVWAEGIEENLQRIDRKSRRQADNATPLKDYADAIFLQRILDRSSALDPYALRLISKNRETHKAQEYLSNLKSDLGEQHLDVFLKFAEKYYQEVNNAKSGIWFSADSSLLELAEINPPSKTKIKHLLVGNILNTEFTEEQFQEFESGIWSARVIGNSTVKGICKSVEEVRKKQGNAFKYLLSRIEYRIKQDPAQEKKLKADEKEVWSTVQKALKAAEFIRDKLGHSETQFNRYNNSFSMAQLYTILETDRHGFSKTSLAAHFENNWRMGDIETEDGKKSARCSRLPADSVRPFDGILRRTLERQAYEIAELKIKQIESQRIDSEALLIPLIAEENRFEFSLGLATIKNNRKNAEQLAKRLEQQRDNWEDKIERIKQSGDSLCPYTGERIGRYGEIDHIVPRSASRDSSRTIFNSEANLIWASRKGNQQKLDQRYTLSDLNKTYLQQIFGTNDVIQLKGIIEEKVNGLPERFIFLELDTELQNAVRHALFLDYESPAYQKVFRSLATQQSTRVNGTQAWLLKRIIQIVQSKLPKAEFAVTRTQAEVTSQIRHQLAEFDNRFAKQNPQPVASHSIDALCAFAAAASNELVEAIALGGKNAQQGDSVAENMEFLSRLVSEDVQIVRIERKPRYEKDDIQSQPMFKEGIYAEHFLPVWIKNGSVYVGFDGYNSTQLLPVETKQPEQFLELLAPSLSKSISIGKLLDTEKPTKLEVDKDFAFTLFDKVAKQLCDENELLLADLLDALRYTSSNKECAGYIYDTQKKAFNKADEIIKQKNFEINASFNNKQLGKFKGKLTLPAKQDWQNLINHPEIKPLLGAKAEAPNWQTFFADYFNSGSTRSHKQTRRVYSLPIVDSPSGGFRAKRKTPNGEIVWQLMAIEGTSSKGFLVKDGQILWNQTAPMEALSTKNLTEVGGRYFEGADSFISFSDWLTIEVEHPDVLQVRMAPGTKDRRYIEITQSLAAFNSWLERSNEETYSSMWDVPNDFKVKAPKLFAEAHQNEVLGSPRSNIFIKKLGEQVTYWYIVESSNAAMRNAYQAAYAKLKE